MAKTAKIDEKLLKSMRDFARDTNDPVALRRAQTLLLTHFKIRQCIVEAVVGRSPSWIAKQRAQVIATRMATSKRRGGARHQLIKNESEVKEFLRQRGAELMRKDGLVSIGKLRSALAAYFSRKRPVSRATAYALADKYGLPRKRRDTQRT